MNGRLQGWLTAGGVLLWLGACSSDDGDRRGDDDGALMSPAGMAAFEDPADPGVTPPPEDNPAVPGAMPGAGPGAMMPGAMPGAMMPGAMPGAMMPGAMDPAPQDPGNGVPPDPMTPFDGPIDGDPSKPMVSIDGVPCGVPNVGFGGSPPTVKITDRDVVVGYPCAHEGAAVTFFLFLHGTLQEAQKVAFTMNAFPIHRFVDSHNVIVVVPKAVGTQWGNGDNGVDKPHLYDVVNWVYDTFGEKFDIRSMWASGGSWGAFYLGSQFACDPMFEDRLRGVRMVVGSACPACSDRLSCIVAEQELEEGGGMPLSPDQQEMKSDSNIGRFATAHGCEPKMKMPDLGPVRHWKWNNCDPGWVHSYYLGPGNHADPWNDPTSLEYMVEEIKSIE